MRKAIFIAVVLSLNLLFGQAAGWAQSSSEEPDFFGSIKSDMTSVSEESETLAEQNKALKAQLISLQLEVEQLQQDIQQLDVSYVKPKSREREQTPQAFNFKGMGSDELVQEAQNIYLSGQLMPLDDVQRLRELHLYELQYRRQELDLELQLVEFLSRKTQEIREPQTAALEKDIEDNREKIREVLALISEEKRKALVLPRQIEILRTENRMLQEKIRALKNR